MNSNSKCSGKKGRTIEPITNNDGSSRDQAISLMMTSLHPSRLQQQLDAANKARFGETNKMMMMMQMKKTTENTRSNGIDSSSSGGGGVGTRCLNKSLPTLAPHPPYPPQQSSNKTDDLFKRHQALIALAQGTPLSLDEETALADFHRFVRDDVYDDANRGNWRVRMARSYYDKLFKEYAICDLSRFKEANMIGLRWRTEKELIGGKGQFICGERKCIMRGELHSYEVPFQYAEDNEMKLELVKVRICLQCAKKLFYHKILAKSLQNNRGEHLVAVEEGDDNEEEEGGDREEKASDKSDRKDKRDRKDRNKKKRKREKDKKDSKKESKSHKKDALDTDDSRCEGDVKDSESTDRVLNSHDALIDFIRKDAPSSRHEFISQAETKIGDSCESQASDNLFASLLI